MPRAIAASRAACSRVSITIDSITRNMWKHSRSIGKTSISRALKIRIAFVAICLDSDESAVLD
jgi:hypothetical protein